MKPLTQNARYVSSNEVVWRIFEFPIHERDPPVKQLAVYLENGQRVYFTEDTGRDHTFRDPSETTLTNFLICVMILLNDILRRYYTWNKKSWCRKKQETTVDGFPGVKEAHVLGRVYTISPHQGKYFYL